MLKILNFIVRNYKYAQNYQKVVYFYKLFFYFCKKTLYFYFHKCIIEKAQKKKGVRNLKETNQELEKCGTITVSVYKDTSSNRPIFKISSDSEEVLPVSYVIEDTLYLY